MFNYNIPRQYLSKPPTLQSLMESMVNFDNPNPVKIRNLPENARSIFFDFEYPLSDKVSKEYFETQILKKFMMRRIGYETFTAFIIALDVKLNEIMPTYNIMFEALNGWKLFEDGDKTTISSSDNRTTNNSTSASDSTSTSQHATSDRRYSETPQNKLAEVRSGNYISDYNYDENDTTASASGTSSGTSSTTDNNLHGETIERTPGNKLELYTKYIEQRNNIMTMIYKDLDCLFYQVID